MPRRLVEKYERMTKVSRFVTARALREGELSEQIGIDAEVSDCIELAHKFVADYLWRPFWTRIALRSKLNKLETLIKKAIAEDSRDARALRYEYWPS